LIPPSEREKKSIFPAFSLGEKVADGGGRMRGQLVAVGPRGQSTAIRAGTSDHLKGLLSALPLSSRESMQRRGNGGAEKIEVRLLAQA
jgi:hypothetical protein